MPPTQSHFLLPVPVNDDDDDDGFVGAVVALKFVPLTAGPMAWQ